MSKEKRHIVSDTGDASGSGDQGSDNGANNDDQGANNDDQGANNDAGQQANQGSDDSGRAGSDENLKADLAAERKARQAAEKRAKEVEGRLSKVEEATKSETEKALDKARKEGESEATKRANQKLVRMAIRVAAADMLADPSDADVIDASQFDVDDDGNVNERAVKSALNDLIKDKPHWAKPKSNGSADQGARGQKAKSNDMNSFIRQQAGIR